MKTLIQNLFLALGLLALPTLVQAQFSFTTNNGAITITGYNTAAGLNVVIPAATNGYPVTIIGDYSFNGSSITSVIIPNSVSSIGEQSFGDCVKLANVTIGNGVTNYTDDALVACTSLTNIAVAASNPAYSSLGGVLFDKAKATLIQFPVGVGGSYSVTNSVTSIGDYSFEDCYNLTSVTIPNSVTNIGFIAFVSCVGMTNISIPNSITSIGGETFAGCGLTSVTIPDSVTNIGVEAFALCYNLASVTIPNSVTILGNYAFSNCSNLTSVTIPGSVVSFGFEAFAYCSDLTNVTIHGGVTSIGNAAFAYCSDLTSVTIPSSVTSIGQAGFAYCSSLASVTIPNSVTSIGYYAFEDCSNLTSAYFQGNAPLDYETAFLNDPATVYYLYGTIGWGPTFGGVPTALWNPQAHVLSFTGGNFGFNLTGPTNATIVVEACTNLAHAVWLPVATNTFSASGTSTFSDLQSGIHTTRFYRERSP